MANLIREVPVDCGVFAAHPAGEGRGRGRGRSPKPFYIYLYSRRECFILQTECDFNISKRFARVLQRIAPVSTQLNQVIIFIIATHVPNENIF